METQHKIMRELSIKVEESPNNIRKFSQQSLKCKILVVVGAYLSHFVSFILSYIYIYIYYNEFLSAWA